MHPFGIFIHKATRSGGMFSDGAEKGRRLRAIKELIIKERLEDQGVLAKRLEAVYGIRATQAVISRDLKSLGAGKRHVDGRSVYVLPEEDLQLSILRRVVKDVRHNEALICVTTLPGMADFVAEWIDLSALEVLGCIAGENTVFVAAQQMGKTGELAEELRGIMCGVC